MKKTFWDRYKTYDTTDGFGSADSWINSFRARTNGEGYKLNSKERVECKVLSKPMESCSTMDELKIEFRKLILKWHPDRAGDTPENTAMAQRIIQMYEKLKNKFTKWNSTKKN